MPKFRSSELIIGILAATAIWAVLFVFQPFYNPHQTNPQNPSQEKNPDISQSEKADERVARYTLWLTLFTGVLAFSTIGLWIETRRASGRQARDMEASLRVAKNAADAADKSARVAAGTSLPRFLLKGLHLEGMESDLNQVFTRETRIIVTLTNCGNTSAIITEQEIHYTVSKTFPQPRMYFSMKATSDAGAVWGAPEAGEISVGSGKDFEVASPFLGFFMEEGQRRDILEGKTFLWVYGYVRYLDFLDESHTKRFIAGLQVLVDSDTGRRIGKFVLPDEQAA